MKLSMRKIANRNFLQLTADFYALNFMFMHQNTMEYWHEGQHFDLDSIFNDTKRKI